MMIRFAPPLLQPRFGQQKPIKFRSASPEEASPSGNSFRQSLDVISTLGKPIEVNVYLDFERRYTPADSERVEQFEKTVRDILEKRGKLFRRAGISKEEVFVFVAQQIFFGPISVGEPLITDKDREDSEHSSKRELKRQAIREICKEMDVSIVPDEELAYAAFADQVTTLPFGVGSYVNPPDSRGKKFAYSLNSPFCTFFFLNDFKVPREILGDYWKDRRVKVVISSN